MKATETLKHEHEIILNVLMATQHEIQTYDKTSKVDSKKIEKMLDFFKGFADRCHHTKEEKHFFVKMIEQGMSKDSGPIATLLQDHENGRRYLLEITRSLKQLKAGNKQATLNVIENLRSYVQLLRAHINKENAVLFPMADQMLSPESQKELTEAFEMVESEEIGEGVREKYHKLANELSDKIN